MSNDIKYVFGNESSQVQKLVEALGLQSETWQPLHTLENLEGPAVMLSSHGVFHGDTYFLSQLRPSDLKLIYDQHVDNAPIIIAAQFYGREDVEQALHGAEVSHASFLRLQHSLEYHASHTEEVIRDEFVHHAIVAGVSHKQLSGAYECSGDLVERRVYKNRAMTTFADNERFTHFLEGLSLHVSVDIDVLRDTRCVHNAWYRSDGPSLDNLCHTLDIVARKNKIHTFDIVGYNGKPEHLEEATFMYGRILDTVLPHMR